MRYSQRLRLQTGELLRAYARDHFGSQAKAAEAWGVTPEYLSRVIRGLRPAPDWLLDAARIELVALPAADRRQPTKASR